MDLHKLTHEIYEATKYWHLPLLVGFIGLTRDSRKDAGQGENGGLGEVPGDNILPKEILLSFFSRRDLWGRF